MTNSSISSNNTSNNLIPKNRRRLEEAKSDNNDFGNILCYNGYIGYACNDCDRYAEFWPDRYYNAA